MSRHLVGHVHPGERGSLPWTDIEEGATLQPPQMHETTQTGSTLMGPIQIFLLGFEDFQATGGVAAELAALSDAGTVRIIDARFLVKEGGRV